MYRLGAMLLMASLLLGCSTADEGTKTVADKTAEPSAEVKKNTSDATTSTEPGLSAAESAFETLKSESNESEKEFMSKVQSAPADEQMELYMSGGDKKKYAAKFLAFAKANPKTESAYEALTTAARNGDDETATQALNSLVQDFASDERLVEILPNLNHGGMGMPAQRHEDFLTALTKKSTLPVIKGGASFTLFKFLSSLGELNDMIKDQPDMAKSLPKETLAYLKKDRKGLDDQLVGILDDIAENHANVKFGRKKLGDLVGEEKFVLENLSIGKVAPDIEGIDLDDKPFKLSDYRGKVVMLDFWGDW